MIGGSDVVLLVTQLSVAAVKQARALIDETGKIHDIEWHEVEVRKVDGVTDFEVQDYQVVMYGRRRRAGR